MRPSRSIDFLPPTRAWLFGHVASVRRRGLAQVLLGVAVLLLVASVAASALQRNGLETRQAKRVAAEPRPRAMVAASASASASAAGSPSLTAADRARINRVVRSLNAPWASIFQALEAQSSAKVAVLALETDSDRGSVRVLTEGPALDELLAHAQRVQDSAPFVRTELLRIDAPEGGAQGAAVATNAKAAASLSRLNFDVLWAR